MRRVTAERACPSPGAWGSAFGSPGDEPSVPPRPPMQQRRRHRHPRLQEQRWTCVTRSGWDSAQPSAWCSVSPSAVACRNQSVLQNFSRCIYFLSQGDNFERSQTWLCQKLNEFYSFHAGPALSTYKTQIRLQSPLRRQDKGWSPRTRRGCPQVLAVLPLRFRRGERPTQTCSVTRGTRLLCPTVTFP